MQINQSHLCILLDRFFLHDCLLILVGFENMELKAFVYIANPVHLFRVYKHSIYILIWIQARVFDLSHISKSVFFFSYSLSYKLAESDDKW